MFLDIEKELSLLSSLSLPDRAKELQHKVPNISLYAVGGFQIQKKDESFYLLNEELTASVLANILKKSIGVSGMLTYTNKSKLTSLELGNKCCELKHLWAENWIMLSFLICVPNSKRIELSILRDKNFYESWIETTEQDELKVFGITGSLKQFKKFISHRNDLSFDKNTRIFMNQMFDKFEFIWNL